MKAKTVAVVALSAALIFGVRVDLARVRVRRDERDTLLDEPPLQKPFIALVGTARADEVRPTRDDRAFSVELRWHYRAEDAVAECIRLGAWPAAMVPRGYMGGCNIVYVDRTPKHCVIIAPTPKTVDDRATLILGHELVHCALGRYH